MKNKQEKNKQEKPSRGIETMFRITSANQQRLSAMADNKAHIMITVNSIILSVVISVLLRKIEEYSNLAIPSVMLLSVNVATLIFSVLATRPEIADGIFTAEQVKRKEVNLLFFGNFHSINLKEYTAGMKSMMMDSDFLYGSLIKDIHAQGVVLNRKYHLLRIAYNVFMFGIIISVFSFIIAAIIF